MDGIKKLLKELSLRQNLISTLLGIILFILLIFASQKPGNSILMLIVFAIAGLMNISNGMKLVKDPKRKSMGMSFLLFGMILIFLGFIMLV